MKSSGILGKYLGWLLKYGRIRVKDYARLKLLTFTLSAVMVFLTINYSGFINRGILLLLMILPDLLIAVKRIVAGIEAQKELSMLKKLIVLNGSIKPADFNEVLDILIYESLYYKPVLEEIKNVTARNTINNSDIYGKYMRKAVNLSERLFFEKLCEAQNYSFDQAVRNISYEYKLERRERERNVRKRVEMIHLWGIAGTMAVIFLLILYLITPWMGMLNIAGDTF